MKNNETNWESRMTRRELLGVAASVTAFAMIPRYALGGPGKSAPSEKGGKPVFTYLPREAFGLHQAPLPPAIWVL